MPSPYTGSPTRSISPASSSVEHDELINPLLGPLAWGSPFTLATGGVFTLTYSFPWVPSGSLAWFQSDYGDGQDKADTRLGLNATQQLAFEAALQSWASVANISFSKITETSTNVGEIRIAFSSAVDGGFAGYAYYPNSYYAAGGDIWLDPKISPKTWEKNNQNFDTLVHELGHALGLSHPNDNPDTSSNLYTVMSYVSAPKSTWITDVGNNFYSYRYIQPEGPQLHDILAIQYLYGANYKYNNGDDTYTFDPSTPFFRTLWDGGGKDTISASNFREPVNINLNAGSFSSLTIKSINPDINWTTPPDSGLYDGTNNLAIAYGVVIENAIGGSGNDKLIGNSASNYLDGGAGDDELFGGDGNDYFDWDHRAGSDKFYGGKGDDVFVFDRSSDRAYESAGEGTDTIWVTFSYSLPNDQEIENLLGFGDNDLVLNGNALNNRIKGSDGNDRLYGGGGNDTFEYTKGQDFFDGGAGTDRLLLEKPRFSYTVSKLSDDSYKLSLIGWTDTYTIQAVEEVQFGSVILRVSELVDTTAPTLSSASPADEATGVAIGSNLVLTFSEAISKGTGTLVLKNSAGTVIESFNVATSSAVTVSGSTLTVNPTSDLAYSTGYRLEIPSGAIKDTAGNSYAGTTAYNFTTVADTSTVTATRDEQDTGTGSLSSAYSDAPASTATTFTLAIGQQNVAKGLLNPGLLADSDSYKLGELSAGNYKFTAKGSSWFSSSDFSGSVTPTLALYDSTGKVVATSSTGTLEYSVSAKGSFFLYVTGAGSQKSQYEVYYESIQAGKQFTGDEADNQIVGTAGSDVISAGGGNDVITGGAGDDTIDGGAGFDTVIWSGNSKNFDVSYNAGTWTVKDNSSGLGTDTLKNVENLQFTDRSVLIQSEAHGSYADLPADLYQFFIVAFNAAPGVTYMNQLAEAYRFGLSVKEIVDIYVTKSQFTDLYPTTLTNKELAVRLVDNIVKDSATASIKASAAEDIEAAMSVGYSRADVLYTVFGNLANKPFTDPTWGNTAKFFANQIAVAKAYTEAMDQSTTDLATLRSALAAVTKDSSVATESTAIGVVIDGLFGNSPPASASTPLGFASFAYSDEEDPDTNYPTLNSTGEFAPPELEEPYRWSQYDVIY